MSSERDELAEVIWDEEACDWRQSGPNEVADAIITAGYIKLRQITTIGDLAGLSDGVIIHTAHGKTMELINGHWQTPNSMAWWSPIVDWLPALVLYSPVVSDE